jgi:DeoR/GlpR family transcriptional regulator of sugar metabolism
LHSVENCAILAIEANWVSFLGIAMLAVERRNRLLEMVRVRRFATLPELAEQLEVSESTVRRDLDQIEEQGAARRIRVAGGLSGI